MPDTPLKQDEIAELEMARDLNEGIFTFYTRVHPLLPRLLAEVKKARASGSVEDQHMRLTRAMYDALDRGDNKEAQRLDDERRVIASKIMPLPAPPQEDG